MSSIFSTQKRQTFLRRKYCFFPTAAALSPPVGRCEAAIGLPPLGSAMFSSPSLRQQTAQRPPRARGGRGAPELPKWELPARDEPGPRLPPLRPAFVGQAKAAEPRPADAGARAF